MEKGTSLQTFKILKRGYYEYLLYANNKFDKLDKIDKILEKHNLPN